MTPPYPGYPPIGQSGYAPAPYGVPGQPAWTGRPAPAFGPGGTAVLPRPGAAPAGPPPRRRNPLRAVLVALIGVVVVAIAALVAVNLIAGSKPTDVAYQNDDYKVPPPGANPPPLPKPQTPAEVADWTTKNKIYEQAMPAPIRCEVSRVDFASADDALLKSHFESVMACLIRAWYLPAQSAGYELVTPSVTIYGDSMTTKCGTTGINAFYCGADQQVYYSRLIASRAPILAKNPWAADAVIAHEFGHAVQGRTGILYAETIQENSAPDKHEQLLLSRRTETQADCFSGLFLRSVSTSIGLKNADVPQILEAYYSFGGDILSGKPNVESDHGLGVSRRYWGQTGLANSAIGKCNTFVADKSLVR